MTEHQEALIAALRARSATLRRLGYRVRFEVSDAAGEVTTLLLDASAGGFAVTPADAATEADTVLRLAEADLARLLEGRLSPMLAFSTGRLRVEGSRGVALKLAGLLDEA
jgi:hypothetical protein